VSEAGGNLRSVRERLGFTMRDVEVASDRIAEKYRNEQFSIPPSRLSDIETRNLIPSIYRIYTLSVIYRLEPRELLAWYHIELDSKASDTDLVPQPRSHLPGIISNLNSAQNPLGEDAAFDKRQADYFRGLIDQWGLAPLSYLPLFAASKFVYGYVGTEDLTMYPLLRPGTFVQVDGSRKKVLKGPWHSEYDRPIYFVETRDGYTCCWCSIQNEALILHPHPLSPVQVRVLSHHREAEVVGQVIGVAMRLAERIA